MATDTGDGDLFWDTEIERCVDSYYNLVWGEPPLNGVEVRPVDISPVGETPAQISVYLHSGPVGICWKGEYEDERGVEYGDLRISGMTFDMQGAEDPVAIFRVAAGSLGLSGEYGRSGGTIETQFGPLGFQNVQGYVFVSLPPEFENPEKLSQFFKAVGEEYQAKRIDLTGPSRE